VERAHRELIGARGGALDPSVSVTAVRVRYVQCMRIAVLAFDGFNEIDSFVVEGVSGPGSSLV
jgi:hypothetical protein